MKSKLISLLILSIFATAGFAAGDNSQIREQFVEIDANNDGQISKEEAGSTDLDAMFSQVDSDGNGYITLTEYANSGNKSYKKDM